MRLLVLLLVGCTQPEVRQLAITNGSDDANDPAVVPIRDADGKLLCTGSAIAPHVVLTAAHCGIDALDFDQFQVGTITNAVVHPGFSGFDHDLALLFVKEEMAALLSIDRGDVQVGRNFAVVGFGSTGPGAGDSGQKRRGTATVTAVSALDFTATAAPSQPCEGDSGGPALFSDTLVSGVASHGDSGCSDHAVFARIDAAFIDGAMPSPAMVGERCFWDAMCETGSCLQAADEPKRWFCSRACARDADCPAKMECKNGCRYKAPSPGALGSACGDCASGICQGGICSRRCAGTSDRDCPSGYACTNTQGIDFFCLPAPHDSGCAVGGSSPAPWWLVLILFFRRRTRCARRHLPS